MREIIMQEWCDWCDANGKRTLATTVATLDLDGTGPKESDLCAECDEQVLGPVRKLVEVGRIAEPEPVKRARPKAAPTTSGRGRKPSSCPICENGVLFYNVKSVADHIWNKHIEDQKPRQPVACPDCGYRHESPNAMARHRTTRHGWSSIQEALDEYEARQHPKRRARRG